MLGNRENHSFSEISEREEAREKERSENKQVIIQGTSIFMTMGGTPIVRAVLQTITQSST